MAYIRKRNNKWQVAIRSKYHAPIYKSFIYKLDAENYALDAERSLQRGLFEDLTEATQTSLGDLLERFKTTTLPSMKSECTYKYTIGKLKRHTISKLRLTKLTSSKIAHFLNDMLQSTSPSTANRYLSLIKAVLNRAMNEYGIYLPKNPATAIKRFKEPPPRDRRFTNDEYKKILEVASNVKLSCMKNIIIFCIETTARRGEALKLTVADVDFFKSTAMLRDTKNGANRVVPLSPKALEVLSDQCKDSLPTAKVFSVRSVSQFRFYWERICQLADIDLPFHTTRHEGISRLFERGYSIADVQKFSGHRDLKSLQGYIHIQNNYLVDKLRNEFQIQKVVSFSKSS